MKKLQRKILLLALALILVFTAVPVLAEEAPAASPPVFSPWAILDLTDSQYFGLTPMTSDADGKDYTVEISQEELETLEKNFLAKLERNNVKVNENFKPEKLELDNTRNSIIRNIFNVMGRYDLNVNNETDPIDYLVSEGILRGNGEDLKLEEKATIEEAITFYVRGIRKIYEKADLGSKGVFYKIKNKGNTAYLFGTVHLGDVDMYPIHNSRIQALIESDVVLPELNLLDQNTILEVGTSQFRTDGSELKDEIGEELFNELAALFTQMGVTEEVLNTMETWAVINNLSNMIMLLDDPTAPLLGIDMYVLTNSMFLGKEIQPLETVETQMGTLDEYYRNFSDESKKTIRELLDGLDDEEVIKETQDELKTMMKAWKEGDEEVIVELFEGDESSQILVKERDPEMAKKIKELLKKDGENTYFVMVGSGHYSPEGSVLTYLEDYGFEIIDLNK